MQLAGDYTALCTVNNLTTTTHVNTANIDALPFFEEKMYRLLTIRKIFSYMIYLYVKTADCEDAYSPDAHIHTIYWIQVV
jgi:hypothetical protein